LIRSFVPIFQKLKKKPSKQIHIFIYGIEVGVNTMEEGLARWS
jgi:hypothetical protein